MQSSLAERAVSTSVDYALGRAPVELGLRMKDPDRAPRLLANLALVVPASIVYNCGGVAHVSSRQIVW